METTYGRGGCTCISFYGTGTAFLKNIKMSLMTSTHCTSICKDTAVTRKGKEKTILEVPGSISACNGCWTIQPQHICLAVSKGTGPIWGPKLCIINGTNQMAQNLKSGHNKIPGSSQPFIRFSNQGWLWCDLSFDDQISDIITMTFHSEMFLGWEKCAYDLMRNKCVDKQAQKKS